MQTSVALRSGRFVQLLKITMSHAVHQVGFSPPDCVTFGLPIAGAISKWQGVEPPEAPLVSFGSAAEFDGVSRSGFQAVTFSFQKTSLFLAADRLGIGLPEDVLLAGTIFAGSADADKLLLGMSAKLLDPSGPKPDETDEDAFVLALLQRLTEKELHVDKSSMRKRDLACRRAIEYMEACTGTNTPISEICYHSGASWRTLERAFNERFGIGPKAYYKQLRLLRSRSMILKAGPDMLVADVANLFGFWHMGAFANDYRRYFGCLPSDDIGTEIV